MITIFPASSFHAEVNPGCEKATIAAAFTSEDPVTRWLRNRLFPLTMTLFTGLSGRASQGEDIDKVRDTIPKGIAIKVDEC